jgi:hypothetical protein
MVVISGDGASPKGLRVYRVKSIELIFEINHSNGPIYIPVRNILLSVQRSTSLEQ